MVVFVCDGNMIFFDKIKRCVLYEAAALSPPFTADNQVGVFDVHVHSAPLSVQKKIQKKMKTPKNVVLQSKRS